MVTINLETDVVIALWIITLFTQILPSNLRSDTIFELAQEINLKKIRDNPLEAFLHSTRV